MYTARFGNLTLNISHIEEKFIKKLLDKAKRKTTYSMFTINGHIYLKYSEDISSTFVTTTS